MGWQKDDIEELASELDIDGGDSWSQQERLRRISEQVGMKNYNGLSNSHTDELAKRLKALKQQRRNNNGNNYNIKAGNNRNRHNKRHSGTGIPGKNLSSRRSKGMSMFKLKPKNVQIKIKMPIKVKIALYGLLILLQLVALVIFVVILSNEEQALTGGGGGGFAYGQTCTTVTVISTDCDSNNQNCTNKYDGAVEAENYIAGVVAAESNGNTNLEYLKLLSVAARTNFIENVDDNCIVEGNSNFLNYMDVNASSNSSQVKQAVSDTKNFIAIADDNVVELVYGYGNIVNEDENNYYISYGKNTLETEQLQVIPKSWTDSQSIFKNYLDNWKSSTEPNTELSLIGALYLITTENYDYKNVVEYYYGETVEITENTMILSGANGFLNPTPTLKCTSAFGYRIDPVSGKKDAYHSGIDIGVSEPIYAAKSGTISYVLKNVTVINAKESNAASGYGYGNYISIDHGDGTLTLYAHIKYGSIPDEIYSGATVEQGQQIGHTGSTGRSTGVHLHYEVRVNGERVDPADYLDLTNATGPCRR